MVRLTVVRKGQTLTFLWEKVMADGRTDTLIEIRSGVQKI